MTCVGDRLLGERGGEREREGGREGGWGIRGLERLLFAVHVVH